MRESPRKHSVAQKQKKDKQPKKVVDLEVEEGQGIKDIDAQGVEPITKLPDYISLCKGKVKVAKDPDSYNFSISTPLLPEQVPFEGLQLAWIPFLKMEDCDLANHARFPHLAIDKYMKHIYYAELGVTTLEMVEWIRGVENLGLLNLL